VDTGDTTNASGKQWFGPRCAEKLKARVFGRSELDFAWSHDHDANAAKNWRNFSMRGNQRSGDVRPSHRRGIAVVWLYASR
jgi:hypothetical protein